MKSQTIYKPKNHIRIVTAASLFDGHDAAINVMRRILQSSGIEVIHLGHNRSVAEIVDCAIQEDVQAVAITSYQGGHIEFFKYMFDLFREKGNGHIKIFGGGGGVILPEEIEELQNYGITRIYSPEDGRIMGLQGMINDLIERCDFPRGMENGFDTEKLLKQDINSISRLISAVENNPAGIESTIKMITKEAAKKKIPILGITGTGGSGKSSLVDEIVRRFVTDFPDKSMAIVCVDPSKRKTGGALLGDRIRMNSINHSNVYVRSMATRQSNLSLSKYVSDTLNILKVANFDLIVLETSGIGQSDTEITDHSDVAMYVMTPEYGAPSQLEKIDMLDFADIIALNKFDKRGGLDSLRDVKKQYQRNHTLFSEDVNSMPVYGTIASQFNDPGVNQLYIAIIDILNSKVNAGFSSSLKRSGELPEKLFIIPPNRIRYLSEITETIRDYNSWAEEQADIAQRMFAVRKTIDELSGKKSQKSSAELISKLEELYNDLSSGLESANMDILEGWADKVKLYRQDEYLFKVRDKEVRIKNYTETLSHLKIPKISTPRYTGWGDILRWNLLENVPGEFPYTAGTYLFKREGEDPTRMFAGEGGPERTNKRFHFLSKGLPAKRLSTAFDSVTLYGNNPDIRPDIYGKIGNSGVSVCCLDDAKKLYSGFNLADARTSVSMTINGPAPMLVGFYMNAAIDQQCEIYIDKNGLRDEINKRIEKIYREKGTRRPSYQGKLPEGNDGLGLMLLGVTGDQVLPAEVYNKIKSDTLKSVRGTVQADILKEDQGQNTCIFSTDFALKMMGDVQQYFTDQKVRNFYSVSISGYHIAEAGANPISQVAFTLSNGFTFVEYYLSRGMDIDKFAPNLSFFFSNGLDIEFSVIGRVARAIWSKAMKYKYKGNNRSQQLKYHIQTSGRSLHAQEVSFNDIRTTLQALFAIYDNCNSLHTNAYDEAITTPTEESVRRAVAIQMIINHEYGMSRNQNPLQGSFIIEELTQLVEEAILAEFDRITDRGGVLGAMETTYQRSKIQEESMYYETLKHSGELPIMGVNAFLPPDGPKTEITGEVIRATVEEKEYQIEMLKEMHSTYQDLSSRLLNELKQVATKNQNVFEKLMEVTKYCSIGQITDALYQVGGEYRRNM